MPTGYTNGIINGTTKTFQDFAKDCMRAFGATIHMRGEDMDKEYKPRVPSDYYTERVKELEKTLHSAKTLTDKELIEMRKKKLNKDMEYYVKNINKTKIARKKLEEFLVKAKAFNPPTPEHKEIATFMVKQLESTIKYDGDTQYSEEELAKIDLKLENIDADEIRNNMIDDANKDIAYYIKEYNAEKKRCDSSNKWVTEFIESLNRI